MMSIYHLTICLQPYINSVTSADWHTTWWWVTYLYMSPSTYVPSTYLSLCVPGRFRWDSRLSVSLTVTLTLHQTFCPNLPLTLTHTEGIYGDGDTWRRPLATSFQTHEEENGRQKLWTCLPWVKNWSLKLDHYMSWATHCIPIPDVWETEHPGRRPTIQSGSLSLLSYRQFYCPEVLHTGGITQKLSFERKRRPMRKSLYHTVGITLVYYRNRHCKACHHYYYCLSYHCHHHHQSLNREGRWGTRWFCNQFSPFSPVLHCPLGFAELQACPFPDVAFPPLPLSALSSSPLSQLLHLLLN